METKTLEEQIDEMEQRVKELEALIDRLRFVNKENNDVINKRIKRKDPRSNQ